MRKAVNKLTRRSFLKLATRWISAGTLLVTGLMAPLRSRAKDKALAALPKGYKPTAHEWCMGIDIEKCIGCGRCGVACKAENDVPKEPYFFRTWVERYFVWGTGKKTLVDSPNGGIDGFPENRDGRGADKSFYVPKMCNHCEHSPCEQVCPVGATFRSPDGVVLVDKDYCIGCRFCVQACPYGCRFINPETMTADKCTMCYHRITKGLLPACAEVCPTGARMFGDLKDAKSPIHAFLAKNKVQVLKPHLRTHPRVFYAGLDKEVK